MNEAASAREFERGHPDSSRDIWVFDDLWLFPWHVLWLVEFVFAFVAARFVPLGCGGFSFCVARGFVGFGFCHIPFALNLCAAFAFGCVLAH
jgi:hypothetical protein